MKVIILNSGLGKRLADLTKDKPKCLINITQEETILGYQLTLLKKNNLLDVIITTGPFEDLIKEYIKNRFSEFNIKYIFNPKYNSTNYIYSLYLKLKFISHCKIEYILLFMGTKETFIASAVDKFYRSDQGKEFNT